MLSLKKYRNNFTFTLPVRDISHTGRSSVSFGRPAVERSPRLISCAHTSPTRGNRKEGTKKGVTNPDIFPNPPRGVHLE
jgi:hypothetical protein